MNEYYYSLHYYCNSCKLHYRLPKALVFTTSTLLEYPNYNNYHYQRNDNCSPQCRGLLNFSIFQCKITIMRSSIFLPDLPGSRWWAPGWCLWFHHLDPLQITWTGKEECGGGDKENWKIHRKVNCERNARWCRSSSSSVILWALEISSGRSSLPIQMPFPQPPLHCKHCNGKQDESCRKNRGRERRGRRRAE